MDPIRKHWNEQQQALRSTLANPEDQARAVKLFLSQHAMLHSAEMSQSGLFSFEDQVWNGLEVRLARLIPSGNCHSIAWNFWHLSRIEDITMNILVAGQPQLLAQDRWYEKMNIKPRDTGNEMDLASVVNLSSEIDIDALRGYRLVVGRQTRVIVQQLQFGELDHKVDPARLEQLRKEGAVSETAVGLLDYWGGLTIAGLLLMPPTRHTFIHLNEALKIKEKLVR